MSFGFDVLLLTFGFVVLVGSTLALKRLRSIRAMGRRPMFRASFAQVAGAASMILGLASAVFPYVVNWGMLERVSSTDLSSRSPPSDVRTTPLPTPSPLDEVRMAGEAAKADAARKAEEAARAEQARMAEQAARAEEARRAEEAASAQQARKAAEAASAEEAAKAVRNSEWQRYAEAYRESQAESKSGSKPNWPNETEDKGASDWSRLILPDRNRDGGNMIAEAFPDKWRYKPEKQSTWQNDLFPPDKNSFENPTIINGPLGPVISGLSPGLRTGTPLPTPTLGGDFTVPTWTPIPWRLPTPSAENPFSLPTPTPTPSPVTHAAFANPVWNLWTEATDGATSGSSFQPAPLERARDYALVVNLAALSFKTDTHANLYSLDAGKDFVRWLDEWLKRNPTAQTATLTLVTVADAASFEIVGPRVKDVVVDVAKLRQARQNGFAIEGDPLDHLRRHAGQAPFSFATQSFRFRTLNRVGRAPIVISIWAERKPVGELALNLCVNGNPVFACQGSLTTSNEWSGMDLSLQQTWPDFALHLIDEKDSEGKSGIVGVLRCNSCDWEPDRYPQWKLNLNRERLEQSIKYITDKVGKLAKGSKNFEADMADAGDELYNAIFPTGAEEAARAFADFIGQGQQRKKEGKGPPKLFVRLIADEIGLTLAPIGLMRVTGAPGSEPVFVGSIAEIQSPLEFQDYSAPPVCLNNWVLFVPPANPKTDTDYYEDVMTARRPFETGIGAVRKVCGDDCVIEDENRFRTWLKQSGPQESDVLVILSHHEQDRLFFSRRAGAADVHFLDLRRSFGRPSLVVLDACGTSVPGASEFIRRFNLLGMSSAVATSTEVEPQLAGAYLAKFMALLESHAGQADYTLSRTHFDTVAALEPEYGAKALIFVLAGNGALRLCAPGSGSVPASAPPAAARPAH